MPFRVRACVVCEQARPEVLGKWTLLGFFGLAPTIRVAIANFQLPVTLCFGFMSEEFAGRITANVRVVASSGPIGGVSPPVQADIPATRPLTMLFLHFQGVAPGPGRYTVVLTVNGEDVFETSFLLENPDQSLRARFGQAVQ